jgi:hypothetical protein
MRVKERSLLDLELVQIGVPKAVVEHAAQKKREAESDAGKRKDDNLRYDEVWCVFDVDEHPDVPEAKQQAVANEIHLAISNPCFELWLLLHFQAQTAHIARDHLQLHVRKNLPRYEKEVPYEMLEGNYEEALKRAQDLDLMHDRNGNTGGNSSTGIYKLTERIKKSGGRMQAN